MHSSPSSIPTFLRDHGIQKVIGVSGGAISPPPGVVNQAVKDAMQHAANLFEKAVIEAFLARLRPYNQKVAILTGGTKFGVPATAATTAKEFGFKTIGVFPATGADKALGPEILDLSVRVDIRQDFDCHTPEEEMKFRSDWGDESPHFCKTIDGCMVFGGRSGTMIEVAHLLKMNERRKKYNQAPKFIVPILASGGMGDVAPTLPADPDVRAWCLPSEVIRSGKEAAELLERKMHLHDLLDDSIVHAAE